ncbi:HET-domain-containing protein [Nemania sp. FL0031]|nr:HET-domain-containing protein [Nemania sp. FL0031]
MEEYQYDPLQNPKQDIRLVTIFPGEFNNPIQIQIARHQLVEHKIESHPPRFSLQELQQRLPEGWDIGETLEGRYIFEEPDSGLTTWTHPDPTIDPACYRPEEDARGYRAEPTYEALSYTWGSQENPERIAVKGSDYNSDDNLGDLHQSQTYIIITRNLAEAIRYLRHREKIRTIWIDALCINQNDNAERGEQVARMGQIYSRASRVLAFLGPDFPGAYLAFPRLDYLGRQTEFTIDSYGWRHPDCQDEDVWKRATRLPFTPEVWEAIICLGGQSWFKRLWVLQEIQLASTSSIIKCGHAEISWPVFRRAVLCIYRNGAVPSHILEAINNVVYSCADPKNMPFDEMLFRYGHSRLCQDQRDKVYGFLSLAPPDLVQAIRVDYQSSVMDVFKQFLLATSQMTARVDLLKYCGRERRSAANVNPNWPSWVPDWRTRPAISTPLRMGHCVSGVSRSAVCLSSDDRLDVDALFIATVDSIVSDELESLTQIVSYLKSVKEVSSKTRAGKVPGTGLDMHLRVLTRDMYDERKPKQWYGRLQDWKDLLRENSPEETTLSTFEEDYTETLSDWWNDQVLFASKGDRLGASRCSIRPGDQVFAVLGCTVPLVMRQNADGTYQVIGDCYLSGAMDGEAILGEFGDSWTIEVIREEDGENRPQYTNAETGERTSEDPRLRDIPLPPEWAHIEWERTRADPLLCSKFRSTRTGETINSDPRLLPDALRARGFDIQRITLV